MADKVNLQRIAIFLDGSNFYHRIKDAELDFKESLDFNYKSFAEWLAYDKDIVSMTYYVGLVR